MSRQTYTGTLYIEWGNDGEVHLSSGDDVVEGAIEAFRRQVRDEAYNEGQADGVAGEDLS